MKRFSFLLGIGVGFLIGSRAGRGPYEQLEARVRAIAGRPAVQSAAEQVTGSANQVKSQVKEAAGSTVDDAAVKVDDVAAKVGDAASSAGSAVQEKIPSTGVASLTRGTASGATAGPAAIRPRRPYGGCRGHRPPG